jgi:hypothetical protein
MRSFCQLTVKVYATASGRTVLSLDDYHYWMASVIDGFRLQMIKSGCFRTILSLTCGLIKSIPTKPPVPFGAV